MNTLANLARVLSVTTGQGTLTLGQAVPGFNTFAGAGVADGQTVTYAIEDYSSDTPATVIGREIGAGVYSAGTLTRGTVYSSTSSGSKINCSGRQHVFITAAKEDFDSLAIASDLTAHLSDTSDAHAASAISFSATGGIASTDVQAAIAELDSEKLSTSAAASTYQPLDGDLTALAALSGTNTIYYRSAADTWTAVTVNATLGFSAGTLGGSLASNYQPLDSELTAIAGLTSAADRLPYFTGSGTASLATFTTAGRALIDDADASAQRTTLSALFGTVGGVTSVYAGQTAAAMNNHTILVGQSVGSASMAANNNILIGGGATSNAGDGITSGNFNIVIGNNSGASISSGTNNIVIGASCGTAITTTSYNTLLGGLAGQYVTGQYNACFGYNAGTGQSGSTDGESNVAFGNFALKVFTTADNCTAVGSSALVALTTASGTTAIGVSALANITTGLGNSAVGNSAGFYLPTSAAQNTLIGDFTLAGASGVTTNAAADNTVIGYNAAKGAGWTSGAKNTIIGSGAMSHSGVASASNNIAIGYNCANSVITTGTYNIFIGDAIAPAAATQSNEINIGGVYRGTNTANSRANPYGAILGWTNSGDVAPAAGTGVTQLPAECFTIGSQVIAAVKTWFIYVNDAGTVKKLQIAVA